MVSKTYNYIGFVERVTNSDVSGWAIDVECGHAIVVTVCIGKNQVAKIRADITRGDVLLKHGKNAAGFQFRITDSVKEVIAEGTPISVLFPDGKEIKTIGSARPVIHGSYGGKEDKLEEMLAAGKIVNPKSGDLITPLKNRKEWGQLALMAYKEAQSAFLEVTGLHLFLMYGTLLGCIRENNFIGHDDDLDVGFFSDATNASDAAAHFIETASKLADMNYKVRVLSQGNYHFFVKNKATIDVFILWKEGGILRGYNIGCNIGKLEIVPAKTRQFRGHNVLVPNNAEEVLEGIYGPGWRTPDPLFQWRTTREVALKMAGFSKCVKKVAGATRFRDAIQ